MLNKCWASSLKDCSEQISREHLVYRSVFLEGSIAVQGLKWCKDAPKTIGLSSLTSKNLCRYHNSSLSELDDAAKDCFDAIRKADKLHSIRSKLQRVTFWHVKKYQVSGNLLERWFLKTLVNLTYGGDLPIGPDSDVPGFPSDVLVEIAFGKASLSGEAGLYSVIELGEKIQMGETIAFSPLIYQQSFIGGALFKIKGLRFLLFLGPSAAPETPFKCRH